MTDYESPTKFGVPQGDYVNAQELADLKTAFLIVDARDFTGKDMKGNPAAKVAFHLLPCNKKGEPGTEKVVLTLGSTSVREDMVKHFSTDANPKPIGLCYLLGKDVAGGKKLWVFADYAELDGGGTQQTLPVEQTKTSKTKGKK